MSTLRSGPAAGTGLATVTPDGVLLDTWYPAPVLDDDAPDVPELEKLAGEDADRGVRTTVVRTRIASLVDAPADTADAYLRLHLLCRPAGPPAPASTWTRLRRAAERCVDLAWASQVPPRAGQWSGSGSRRWRPVFG